MQTGLQSKQERKGSPSHDTSPGSSDGRCATNAHLHRKHWSKMDEQYAYELYRQGVSYGLIAARLGRTVDSIVQKVCELNKTGGVPVPDDPLLKALQKHHGDKADWNARNLDDGMIYR